MRTKNVEVKFKFPVRVNEPDCNGDVYTEDVIISACKNSAGMPIIQRNESGEEVPVGVANKVWYENGYINVEGISWYGGTCEEVKFNDLNQISEMEIMSFGICK